MGLTATVPVQHRHNCDCSLECRRRRKAYKVAYERGHRLMVDPAAARRHLLHLAECGVGRKTITQAVGITDPTLYRIIRGLSAKIHRETERKILGFQPADAARVPNARVIDAAPTHLRYQSLVALGYTQAWISGQLGRSHPCINLGKRVSRARALAMLELVQRVGDTVGPSRKAAVQARNRGWRVPADFDEELFYAADWDGVESTDKVRRVNRSHELLEEHDFFYAQGLTQEQIAVRLGVGRQYLATLLRRRRATSESSAA